MHSYDIISNKNLAIRRSNRRSFVRKTVREPEEIREKGDKKVSILMLCYNNTDQFFSMLDRLDREPRRKDFMVTIVQNSDSEEAKKIFDERISQYDNITVLYPISNLGSAGGYALGQEYILSTGYSHLIMLEDDIELYEDDTISHTLDDINEVIHQVIFIHHPANTDGAHSRYVQYACYPTALIERAGVIDPRYYFRAEDLEWGKRIERAISTYGYTKKILQRNYFHPYLKGVNNSGSWIYFSLRNQLWTIKKHGQGIIRFLITLTQYRAFGFLVLFRSGKSLILHCISNAIPDGVSRYRKLEYQAEIIYHLSRYSNIRIEDLGFRTQEVGFEVLAKGVNTSHIIGRTTLAGADRQHLAKHVGDIVASGGFQPVRGTLVACMKTLLIIESFNWDKKQLAGKIVEQSAVSQVVNILLFLPCVLLGFVAALISALPILRVRYIIR